ncbi:MAG: hypothetical protein QG670_1701 [Thermoproteota archaeon]|nr:hypothetical protein [Thermoproteota archaeon]
MIVQSLGWRQTYGGIYDDCAHSVIQTNDGGYAIAGLGGDGYLLIKTDSTSNQMWNRTYKGTFTSDIGYSIIQASEDGYAFAVSFYDKVISHYSDFWLVKIPADAPPYTINDYDGLWHTTGFTMKLSAIDDFSSIYDTYYKVNDGQLEGLALMGNQLSVRMVPTTNWSIGAQIV